MAASGFAAKKKIFDAFAQLAKTEPYRSIKVADICGRAGVSRAAFYHHFSNKYDIVVWHSSLILAAGLDEIGISLTWFEGHLVTTRGIKRFYDLYSLCEPPETNRMFQSWHATHRKEVLRRTLTEVKGIPLTPKLDFQINALANSEEWAIRDWYRGGIDVGIREICELMISIVPRDLYLALEKPEHPTGLDGVFFKELLG